MASPFAIFRRYQRAMLAAFCVLLMVAFGIPSSCMYMERTAIRGRNAVVVTTSGYGELRESDVQSLRQQRNLVNSFVGQGRRFAIEAEKDQWVQRQMAMAMQQSPFPEATERNVVSSWLEAKRAKELGIVITDDAVISFVKQITFRELTPKQIGDILTRLHASEEQLIEAIRVELLAGRLRASFGASLMAATPAQRFGYHQQLNRQAMVELASVPVDRFVSKVSEPDEKTLQEFFDKYKDKSPQEGSFEPGFREPYRATVEYVTVELDKLVDLKAVTDAQIEQYYNEHKEREFVQPKLPTLDEKKEPAEGTKTTEPAKKDEPVKKDEPARKEAPPAAKPAETPKAPAETPKGPAKPASDEKKPASPGKDDAKKKTSARLWGSAVRLASYADEKAAPAPSKPADKPASEAKPAPADKPATEGKPKETPAAKPAEPVKPAVEKKPDAAAAEKKPQEGPALSVPLPSQMPGLQQEPAKPEPPQFVPLEKVKDEIRKRIAMQKAGMAAQRLLDPLRKEMSGHTVTVTQRVAKAEGRPAEMAKFDLAKKAAALKLEVKRLEMVSAGDVAASDVAKSMSGNFSFTQYIFSSPGLGRTAISQDEGHRYLFWKIDEKKAHVPELAEKGIRDRVVRQWKMIQARDLAMAEANRLAAKAEAAKAAEAKKGEPPIKEEEPAKPRLAEWLKDEPLAKVLEPRPFTWLTPGTMLPMSMSQEPPRTSDVEGVDAPGDDLMKAIFALPKEGIGTAMNASKTAACVVRVRLFAPSKVVLWERFLSDSYYKYQSAAESDVRAQFAAWRAELESTAGLKWHREADRRVEVDETAGRPARGPSRGEEELD